MPINRDQRHHDAAGVDRAWDEAARKQAHRDGLPAAVIPSRAIRRVAASDDDGRGLAAAIMRDQPVVIQSPLAGGHVVLRVLILTA